MEPVPESERMEEFRSAPRPTMRLQSNSSAAFVPPAPLSPRFAADPDDGLRKPSIRRSTEPVSPSSPSWPSPLYRPRTTSPLSGFSHVRSRSTASGLFPPAMGRTQSMPGVNGAGHFQYGFDPRSSSPSLHRPPAITTRTPKRSVIEDVFPSSPTRISVHDDRRLFERNSSPNLGIDSSPIAAVTTTLVSLPIARTHRPSSPFRRLSNSSAGSATTSVGSDFGTPIVGATPASSVASSPPYRTYDAPSLSASYSGSGMLSSSSVPSTPTSTRSRSPSINSLETIPDSPDAEEAAQEADRIAQLKAAADAADGDAKGRGSLDLPARGRTLVFGARDKRKRWSVCGAERRGDLDLETIWED